MKAQESENRYMLLRRFTELNTPEAAVTQDHMRKDALAWNGYVVQGNERSYYLRAIEAACEQAEPPTESWPRPQDLVPEATGSEAKSVDSVTITDTNTTPEDCEAETTESEINPDHLGTKSVGSEANPPLVVRKPAGQIQYLKGERRSQHKSTCLKRLVRMVFG